MKFIYFTLSFLLLTTLVKAEKLTIYTYDSFVSEWGPGPIIEKQFEETYQIDLDLVAVDSAATLLNKVILEGEKILIGGNEVYKTLCRKHFRELTKLI